MHAISVLDGLALQTLLEAPFLPFSVTGQRSCSLSLSHFHFPTVTFPLSLSHCHSDSPSYPIISSQPHLSVIHSSHSCCNTLFFVSHPCSLSCLNTLSSLSSFSSLLAPITFFPFIYPLFVFCFVSHPASLMFPGAPSNFAGQMSSLEALAAGQHNGMPNGNFGISPQG